MKNSKKLLVQAIAALAILGLILGTVAPLVLLNS